MQGNEENENDGTDFMWSSVWIFKDSNVNNILIMIFFTTFSIKISCFHISHNKKTQTSTGYCYPAPQGKSCLPKPGEWGQFLMIEWLIYLKPDNKKIEWNAFF